MKLKKTLWVCLFTILCVGLNVGGNALSKAYSLPFWLDSFGTVFCSYILGPVCGAAVGITSNVLMSASNPIAWAYSLTSIAMVIIVGLALKKKSLDTLLGSTAVATMITFVATVVSVPLNFILNSGYTGNRFGDAVIQYLLHLDVPMIFAATAGQFYVEFLDKVLTILALFLLLRLIRREERSLKHLYHENGKQLLIIALTGGILLSMAGSTAEADALEDAVYYNDYVQTIYNNINGLPCGEANDIAMTRDGVLWIGTYAGLYRYNGKEFRWMDSMATVRNVNCLYVDQEGRLWIGTNDSGLAISINEKIVNSHDLDSGLPSNSVRAITQSSDGYYYIGTAGSLQILSLSSGLKKINTLQEMNYTECLSADENGNVAGITSDGRLFLLNGSDILCSLRYIEADESFHCCAFDPDGVLIVGTTANRLLFYDISNGYFDLQYEQTCEGLYNINDLHFPGNDEMFLTADNGVAYLSRDGIYHRINTNDFNNSIDNMLMDFQGNLWFTSSRLGLLRLAPSAFRDIYSTIGIEKNVVNAIAKWNGTLYFATDSGLDAADALCQERVTDFLTEQLEGVRIRCLLVDNQNHFWLCTYSRGLMEVLEDGTIRYYNADNGSFGNKARVVSQLSDGTIFAAGDTGISLISDGTVVKTFGYADGLDNTMILTVTELPDGRILAGTDGAGIAIVKDREITGMITRADGLSSEVILRTVADPKSGGVFVVTSNGLCYLEEDGTVRQLDRFPYFNNYDIRQKDEDSLFVMSSAGIYVVDRDDLIANSDTLRVDLLDSKRGLNSSLTANSWSYCDKDGTLYLPCDTGVYAINILSYNTDMPSFRIAIPYIRLDSSRFSIDASEGIDISNGVGRVELYPEIINYSVQIPDVGYYLEGFDKEWTVLPLTSLGSIVYTNLPAGSYLLHLAVFDSSGTAINTERTFELVKEEEFYETSGFRIYFYGVIVLFLLFLFFLFGYRSYVKLQEKAEMANQTIFAIANTVDAKDTRTSQHSQRVAEYAAAIAEELGKSEAYCKNLRKAALMHDIGKIAIPDSILNKPSRLTDEEYGVMKSHTLQGGKILKNMTLIRDVDVGAKYHHERWDGKGYPDGLKGEEIPEMARIIGVADAFDAMTANRVYRKQMDFDYVINEMEKGRGTQFDPVADDALLKLLHNGVIDLNAIYGVKAESKDDTTKGGEAQ